MPEDSVAPVLLRSAHEVGAAGYRDLLGPDRRRADRDRATFVLEGTRAIRLALDERWPLESILLSQARAEHRPDLVADAGRGGAAVYVAPQEIVDGIAGFHVHRGALARACRPVSRAVSEVVGSTQLVLVVEGVNDHENLGALFRNAAAFGVGGVLLDPTTADPLYRRSVRVSVGQVLRVPFARATSWPDDLMRLGPAGVTLVALDPAGEQTVEDLRPGPAGRVALMVGAEGDGLSPAARSAAEVRVRIPMAAGVDSLNVATAAAIALHRLAGTMEAPQDGVGPRVSP